jgi:periplasmic protein TonB
LIRNPLQLAFCVSVLAHAAVLGVATFTAAGLREPAFQQNDTTTAFTLIAAPKESDVAPSQPAVPVNTQIAPTVQVVPEQVKPLENSPSVQSEKSPELAEMTAPVQQQLQPEAPAPAPAVPAQSVPADVHSDASSAMPGLDVTTVQAKTGIKADANYLANPVPPYPLLARRRHEEGLVLLKVTVTPQGRPAAVTIEQGSGFPLLDDAALQSVRHWEFQPARINSIAVESEIEVPIRFKLE